MNIQKKMERRNKSQDKAISKEQRVKERETFFGRARLANMLEAEKMFENDDCEDDIDFTVL